MGIKAFDDFLTSIKAKIGDLNLDITFSKNLAVSYKSEADAGDARAATLLASTEDGIKKKKEAIEALKAFFITMKKDWSVVHDRVIGHVVWAPPITGLNAPHGYTKDICVIKLDKKKISSNFMGNVIDLGAC
jgi:hypothetical protein